MSTSRIALDPSQYVRVNIDLNPMILEANEGEVKVVVTENQPALSNQAFHRLNDRQRLEFPSLDANVWVLANTASQKAVVTELVPISIGLGDTGSIDAFARLRVSNPETVFDSQLQYDKQPILWDEWGAGTSTHLPDESCAELSVTSGQTVHRQSFKYHRYQPGKSQFVLCTGVLGDGSSMKIVKRSNVTGSVVDTAIPQASWNASTQADFDFSKSFIWFADLEWLGVGRVRTGIVRDGIPCPCHEFLHAGVEDTTYMTTANLPMRYEIISDGATTKSRMGYYDDENGFYIESEAASATGSMKHICTSVISEGGQSTQDAFIFSIGTDVASPVTVTATETPLLAIRPKATFNGITNRALIELLEAHIGVLTRDVMYRVYWNPTITGGTWNSVHADSVVEYNDSMTGFSGSIPFEEAYVFGGAGSASGDVGAQDLESRYPVTLDHDGLNPIPILITATRIGGSNATVVASIQWREVR